MDVISKPAMTQADMKLRTMVERLSYSEGSEGPVNVRTGGGKVLEFDELVVTCPLGWLQKNLDAFNPKLPRKLSNSIEKVGWGCLEKVRSIHH